MAEPSKRPTAISSLLSALAGRDREETIRANLCMMCGGDALEFDSDFSRHEYTIGGMCQECQDSAFGGD